MTQPVFEFREIVTAAGNKFYICLDCEHWQERPMENGTCDCGCHDVQTSEITQETREDEGVEDARKGCSRPDRRNVPA